MEARFNSELGYLQGLNELRIKMIKERDEELRLTRLQVHMLEGKLLEARNQISRLQNRPVFKDPVEHVLRSDSAKRKKWYVRLFPMLSRFVCGTRGEKRQGGSDSSSTF